MSDKSLGIILVAIVVVVILSISMWTVYSVRYTSRAMNICECDSKPLIDSMTALQKRVEALELNQAKCQWMEKAVK